jgi:hypothetical protein
MTARSCLLILGVVVIVWLALTANQIGSWAWEAIADSLSES